MPGTLLAPAPNGPYGIAALAIATPIGRPGPADLPAQLPNLTIDELGDPTNLMIRGPGAPPSRSRVTAPA
jgi:hypothetical protein